MYKNNFLASIAVALSCWVVPSYGDNLVDIYQLAQEHDPTYRAAEAQKNAVYESKGFATANYLPSLDVGASTSRSETDSKETDSTNYSVSINQPLYNRSNFIISDQTNSQIEQADLQFLTTQQDLMVRVARGYFDVLAAQDQVQFSKAEQEAIGRQLEQTKQRFDVGLVAITDVHEAQARYDLSIANGIAAENQLNNSREALRTITGEYHQKLATLGEKTLFVSRPNPDNIDSWTDTALNQNPNLQASRRSVDIARYELKLQRADYYPTLNLSASYNSTDTEFDSEVPSYSYDLATRQIVTTNHISRVSNTTDTTQVQLGFSLNLYSGGRTNTAVRQANFYLNQALENLEESRRSVQQYVRSSYLGVISGISRVKALKQAVVSNESALQAAEAGFEVGTRTTVDVLDARRRLFAAINDHAQARYDYVINWLQLKQAAGTLSEDDLQKVNQWLQQ